MARAEKKAGMDAIADTDHFFETVTPPVAIGPRLVHNSAMLTCETDVTCRLDIHTTSIPHACPCHQNRDAHACTLTRCCPVASAVEHFEPDSRLGPGGMLGIMVVGSA